MRRRGGGVGQKSKSTSRNLTTPAPLLSFPRDVLKKPLITLITPPLQPRVFVQYPRDVLKKPLITLVSPSDRAYCSPELARHLERILDLSGYAAMSRRAERLLDPILKGT